MSSITRNGILEKISSELRREDYILAVWLEGSDGTKSVDEHSDIDLVCYAREGFVDQAISRLDAALNDLGELDVAYEEHWRPANNRYKVYHLADTPQSLLIDVTFQSESFPVSFLHEDKTVVPVVLVDKVGVVKYENVDIETQRSQLREQLSHARGMYSQRSRAVKYTKRGLFLESLIYYQKFVLNPLVEVLRVVHTPFQADCFLVHATRDFPDNVVAQLEHLYGVKAVQDIVDRIDFAHTMFDEAIGEAEQVLSTSSCV
jgi:predicted nucleotidyltransferase